MIDTLRRDCHTDAMKAVTKSPTARQSSKRSLTGRRATIPALEPTDWDLRIEPPPAEIRTLTLRFMQAGVEPPVIRRKPRE